MKTAVRAVVPRGILFFVLVLALAACSRSGGPPPVGPGARPPGAPAAGAAAATGTAPVPSVGPTVRPEDRIVYYPSRDRVLTTGDGSSNDMRWKPVGLVMPADLGRVRGVVVLSDTALRDKDGNSKGVLVPGGSSLSLLAVGDWVASGSQFTRSYRVQGRIRSASDPVNGWIDSTDAALILAEEPGLQVGIIPRKIVVGGGESEYSLLAVIDGTHVTILDTSYFPFPDDFHPSGVVSVSLQDVNADSRTEIILEAETIVSLRYLGATPIRWKSWLRRGLIGALLSIFRYNETFGSDSGYSYSATDRLFDSSGRGFRDTVRVDTDYTLVTGTDEFKNKAVTFFPWNGSQFRHDTFQDLPQLGTISVDHAVLRESADDQSDAVASLSRGDQLYVFDRSDRRQSAAEPRSWWYQAMSKSGIEGWINGVMLDLSWIDPLKTNRATFMTQN